MIAEKLYYKVVRVKLVKSRQWLGALRARRFGNFMNCFVLIFRRRAFQQCCRWYTRYVTSFKPLRRAADFPADAFLCADRRSENYRVHCRHCLSASLESSAFTVCVQQPVCNVYSPRLCIYSYFRRWRRFALSKATFHGQGNVLFMIIQFALMFSAYTALRCRSM